MKKITLTFLLLFYYAFSYSQTTLGLYTERTVTSSQALNTAFGNNTTDNNSFPTGGTDAGTDGGTEVYEVKANADGVNTQFILNYNPRADFSAYNTFYISLKSSSAQPTVLRIQDASDVSATLDASNYGMVYDGNWHTLAVPLSDFTTAAPTIDLTVIKNVFLVKSDPAAAADIVASTYVFYIDDVYLSSATLSNETFELSGISIYPNPASNQIKINSKSDIDSVTIFNLIGKKVLESKGQKTINISSLSSGMYLVKASSGDASITSKFIKE